MLASKKSSKISTEVVINCEGWACTIVKDFEEEKTRRTWKESGQGEAKRSRQSKQSNQSKQSKLSKQSRQSKQGGGGGMYSSSEKSESRADSPVIFVVGAKFL